MAFSTIQGSGSAPDSFVGTSGVDAIVFEGNTNNFFLGAQEANDYIGFDNVAFLQTGTYTNGTVRGGSGTDQFEDLAGVNLVSTWLNGNGDADSFGTAVTGLSLISSSLQGGQGDDTMFVNGASNSLFNGNRDDDTLDFTGVVASSTIGGGQGDDTLTMSGGTLTASSLLLGDGDDTFTQTAGVYGTGNTIEGGDGNDTIVLLAATAADTVINGGAGVDAITSGAGDDTIDGGAGSDVIIGLGGDDIMTGGAGVNTFAYTADAQTGTDLTAGDTDVITDFTSGTDLIAGLAAGAGTTGLASNFDVAAAGVATYTDAFADATAALAAGDDYTLQAVGAGTSWTAYLFTGTAAGGVTGAIQIGETGSFATDASALTAVAATDIVA